MSTREEGQSQASAVALDVLLEASSALGEARGEVWRLTRELRLARQVVRDAEAAELAALRAYESTPYSDEKVST